MQRFEPRFLHEKPPSLESPFADKPRRPWEATILSEDRSMEIHPPHDAAGFLISDSSAWWLSTDNFRKDSRSRCANKSPSGITAAKVTSHSRIPQLAANSPGTSNT